MKEFENLYSVLVKKPDSKNYLQIENLEDCYYAWRVFKSSTLCYCLNGVVVMYGRSPDGSIHIQILDSNDADGNGCVIEKGDAVILKNINFLEAGGDSYPIPSTIGLDSEHEIISTEQEADFDEVYNGICKFLKDV